METKTKFLLGGISFLFLIAIIGGIWLRSNFNEKELTTEEQKGILSYQGEENNISYTPSTETHCFNETCWRTLYSGTMFTQELDNNWYSLTDVSNVTWINDAFRFSYRNYWVDIEPFIVYGQNNNIYFLSDLRELFPNVQVIDYIKPQRFNHKFALNFSNVPQNLVDNVNYFGFRLKQTNGLTWDDIEKMGNNSIVIKNKIEINYQDLVDSHYTLNLLNKTTLLIGNISANYQNESIYLDPTIQLQDADTENLNDDCVYANGYLDYLRTYGTGNPEYQPTAIMFNITSIPADQTITDATLYIYDTTTNPATNNYMVFQYINWTWNEEDGVPGNNVYVGDLLDWQATSGAAEWQDFNVTTWVSYNYDSGYKNVTLAIQWNRSNPNSYTNANSKEYTGDTSLRPYLNITYESGGEPPTGPCWTKTAGKLIIPPGCKYYNSSKEFIAP